MGRGSSPLPQRADDLLDREAVLGQMRVHDQHHGQGDDSGLEYHSAIAPLRAEIWLGFSDMNCVPAAVRGALLPRHGMHVWHAD